MTQPVTGRGQESESGDGGEYFAGGIEVYALTVEEGGRPGVDFICGPVGPDREIPEGEAEFNRAIEVMCRATVTKFPNPQTIGRFYREVKKDILGNRCWYRVTVTARVGTDEKISGRVTDEIDPALVRADPHVKFRARQLRAMLMRGLAEEE
jgi:hypothetical protein